MIAFLAALALAGDTLSLEAVRVVPVGTAPTLTLIAGSDGDVRVEGTCGDHEFSAFKRLHTGDRVPIDLGVLPEGTYTCQASIGLTDTSGGYGSMYIPFEVKVLSPLVIEVEEGDIDLAAKRISVRANRGLARVDVVALGVGGKEVGRGTWGVPGLAETDVEWVQDPNTEVVKLLLTGTDADGFVGRLELIPWRYLIPHEDVVFETASDIIRASEVAKLESAWSDLQTVLGKYGSVVEVQLFIGGYTDTVGTAEYNQGLSERRARSIARWFRDRGYKGPIWYQGFGEGALAVATPDNTDMAANRRALYILAAHPPRVDRDIPRSAWRAL